MDIKICQQVQQLDLLINVPVLKAHCQTKMTCALKNMKGCIPDSEKRKFHRMGLHKPIALLNTVLKPDLTIVDAIFGDLTFEEGGNPVQMDRVLIAEDPVLLDSYAANLLGFKPEDIKYINLACDKDVGSCDLNQAKIVEFNTPIGSTEEIENHSSIADKLEDSYINQKAACSACYANLIQALYRLDQDDKLSDLDDKIKIGQGYREQSGQGPSVGNCTSSFNSFVKGCPPTAADIVDFLKTQF